MNSSQVTALREAIENLINAKLLDAIAKPNGVQRLLANRASGVASPDIRDAEKRLEQVLCEFTDEMQTRLTAVEA